jgi:hypothetical protein
MWGKKARVYYHGIPSFCVGCYTVGHVKADCEENSISWKDYINTLLGSGIEKRLFGGWFRSNLSLSRESHVTHAQPSFKRKNSSVVDDDDENLTLDTLSPKLIALFKKFQSSTPNANRSQNSQASSSNSKPQSAKSNKSNNSNPNRGRGRGRGRGTTKPKNNEPVKGRGRG